MGVGVKDRMAIDKRVLKPIVFMAALVPLARLATLAFTVGLGANPVEVITHQTGLWALILLMVTLSITPLRKLTGQYWLIQYRRMIGLFAFFYACLHFTTYIWLDQSFDVHSMVKDVYKRPFITMGFLAFVLLIPLAVTSTKGWIRRMGKKWQLLHRLIYFSASAGVFHFLWLVKKDKREPMIYVFVLAVLLGYRVLDSFLKRTKPARINASPVSAD
jgi:methionine sulfoxide reductase heme-binding subunit